jgi:hypothetical protein
MIEAMVSIFGLGTIILIGVVLFVATSREAAKIRDGVRTWQNVLDYLKTTNVVGDFGGLGETLVGTQSTSADGRCNGSFICQKPLKRIGVPQELLEQSDLRTRAYYGVLPSLGLLGTFAGVAWSLYEIGKADLTSSDELFRAVNDLLGSMQFAFLTSVVGVLGYLVLQGCHAVFISRINSARNAALTLLQAIPLASAEQALVNFDTEKFKQSAEASAAAAESLEGAAESMASVAEQLQDASLSLDENAQKLATAAENLSAEAIGKAVGERVADAIRLYLAPPIEGIRLSLGELAEIRHTVLQPLVATVSELKTEVDAMNATLDEMKRAVDSNTSANQDLRHSVDSLQNMVGEDLAIAAKALKDAMDSLVSSSSAAANAFKESWSGAARDVADAIHAHTNLVKGTNAELKAATEALRTELELIHAHAATFETVYSGLEKVLNGTRDANAMLSRTAHEMKSTISDFERSANSSLARVVDAFADEQSELVLRLSDALNKLDASAPHRSGAK